jgi:phosphatidylglycerophosphate synthase
LLFLLVGFGRLPDLWIALPILIMMREFAVAGMREFLGPLDVKMPVTPIAKWKTASQMLAISVLIIAPYIPYGLPGGRILLIVATALTLISGWQYLQKGAAHIRDME